MKYEDFDKFLKGLNLLSDIKIRDIRCPIPRGYNIRAFDNYLLLISADGSINVCFDRWREMIQMKAVALYFEDKQIGVIALNCMEVVE